MEEKNIKDLIIDHFNRGAEAVVEGSELAKWLSADPDNQNIFIRYRKIWNEAPHLLQRQKFDATKAWSKIDTRHKMQVIFRNRVKATVYTLSGVAAAVVIFIGLSIFTDLFTMQEQYVNVSTEYGSRSEVILPDGSKVNLNAGSSIQYKYNQVNRSREVVFNGEGFFNVSKSESPFKIETTDGLKVEVLGTEFNLSAYSDDAIIQTTLLEGSVDVTSADQSKLRLKPGQTAIYNKRNRKLSYGKLEPAHSKGWLEGKIYMDEMSLNELFIKLERWYNVDIQYDKKVAEKYHYTGVLEEQTIADVMEALVKISGLEYTHTGTKILITELN